MTTRRKIRQLENDLNKWCKHNNLPTVRLQHTPFDQSALGKFHYFKGGDFCTITLTTPTSLTAWHELGHFVDWTAKLRKPFIDACGSENAVTRYGATSASEALAESFAWWHCKPNELRHRFPLQHAFWEGRFSKP